VGLRIKYKAIRLVEQTELCERRKQRLLSGNSGDKMRAAAAEEADRTATGKLPAALCTGIFLAAFEAGSGGCLGNELTAGMRSRIVFLVAFLFAFGVWLIQKRHSGGFNNLKIGSFGQ